MSITVVIPTIDERTDMLARALRSVRAQTLQPDAVIVQLDAHREGPGKTRNKGLAMVRTEYVAWLDDDDELYPHHLEVLFDEAKRTGADLVYPDLEVVGGGDHRPSFIQVTYLARTSVIQSVGGFPEPFSNTWPYMYEDWGLLALLLNNGAVLRRVPQVTWKYHIHDTNMVGIGF